MAQTERRLRDLYDNNYDLFTKMCRDESHIRWGFDIPKDAWDANPIVEFVREPRPSRRRTRFLQRNQDFYK